jgi:Permuted papain-like amidase enzyme, YaeF/YiiX, C92 family
MANIITKKQLIALPQIDYHQIREYLHTGDLVFCSGNYFFSKMIQKLTKSTWSHVGIIYKDEELGRVLILESETLIGVRLMPLSKYINDYKGTNRAYKGNLLIAKINVKVDKKEMNEGISFGLDELTRPYDNWEIFRILLRILFKKGKRERNKNYICSELVRDIFTKAKFLIKFEDSYISPDGIWNDERVALKYKLL